LKVCGIVKNPGCQRLIFEEGAAILSQEVRADRADSDPSCKSGAIKQSRRFHRLAQYAQGNLLLMVVCAMCIVRLWLMLLPSSLWVDEMATVYVVHHGAADPSLAVAPQVPASLYYWLPWLADRLFGFSEIGYRIPSILAMGIALWLIGRLAARLIHPSAGWFAAMACICLRPINYFAVDARPYALGICIAAAAILFMVRWLDDAKWCDGLLFTAFAALVWWIHLIYWPFYVLLLLYVFIRILRGETQVGWGKAAAVFSLVGLMLLPILFKSLSLYKEADKHVVTKLPAMRDLMLSFQLRNIFLCALAALILYIIFRQRERRRIPGSSMLLIAGWWLCQPICLFLFSYISGKSIFVNRYLSLSLPAIGLVTAFVVSFFIPKSYWKPAALVLAVAALWLKSDWRHTWPIHDMNWRDVARAVNLVNASPDTPVICPSPFIEAQWPVWQPDYRVPSFLYSQLDSYPIQGRIIPFPIKKTAIAEQFARGLCQTTLPAAGRFIIYGGQGDVDLWRRWFSAQPELANWRHRSLGKFDGVGASIFLREP
jgi:hypothetical protein